MFLQVSLKFCIIILFLPRTFGNKRIIKCFVNPSSDAGISGNSSDINFVHLIAEGANDNVHYLWSSYKVPSIIVARTTNDTELSINLTKFQTFESDAITFSKRPLEAVGVTLSELWELNYLKDASEVTDWSHVEALNLNSFNWTDFNNTLKCSEGLATARLNSDSDSVPFSKGGTVEIQFSAAGDEVSSSDFPHLIFTANSTQMKMVLHNLFSNSSRTRYGLKITLASFLSEKCTSHSWQKITSKSINDEFSPGVFSDIELLASCSRMNTGDSSFLTWRPVAYSGDVPIIANSSDARMTSHVEPVDLGTISSIAEMYFSGKTNFSVFNITFGTEGDGFYQKTKYTAWSFMVGVGSVLTFELSKTVVIFLSVGLGALLIFFLSGALYAAVWYCYKKDDDLLLSDSSIN